MEQLEAVLRLPSLPLDQRHHDIVPASTSNSVDAIEVEREYVDRPCEAVWTGGHRARSLQLFPPMLRTMNRVTSTPALASAFICCKLRTRLAILSMKLGRRWKERSTRRCVASITAGEEDILTRVIAEIRNALVGLAALSACGEPAVPATLVSRNLLDPPDAIELTADAAFVRRLELPGGGELRLSGQARGAGVLTARATLVDPGGGPAKPAGQAVASATTPAGLEVVLRLPDPGSALIGVEVSWAPDGAGSSFVAERASVTETAARPHPPIIFVSIDTLAARHMSLYGYARHTTPQLDRFADEALVFDHCVANAPWTTPSYVSQFSGEYPASFELGDERIGPAATSWNTWRLPQSRWTLAEMLAAAGYRTAAFIDNPNIGPGFGLEQGFEVYDTSAADRQQTEPGGGIRHVVPLALDWLDGLARGEPYFLFVQANDVHGPYLPEAPWAGRFADEVSVDPQGELPVSDSPKLFGHIPAHVVEPLFPAGALPRRMHPAPFVAAYDEEILMLDDALGAFFDELRRRGLLDTAVVVVSADHGEATGGHDQWFDHSQLYEDVLHVPLLIRMPGGRDGARRTNCAVQLVDLYPTLGELAGLRGARPYLHGRSLVPLIRGKSLPPLPTFSSEGWFDAVSVTVDGRKLIETWPGQYADRLPFMRSLVLSSPRAQAWFERRYPDDARAGSLLALVERYAGQTSEVDDLVAETMREMQGPYDELFVLADDALEVNDLSAIALEQVQHLKEVLAREQARARAAWQIGDDSPGQQPSATQLEALRTLGYTEGH